MAITEMKTENKTRMTSNRNLHNKEQNIYRKKEPGKNKVLKATHGEVLKLKWAKPKQTQNVAWIEYKTKMVLEPQVSPVLYTILISVEDMYRRFSVEIHCGACVLYSTENNK